MNNKNLKINSVESKLDKLTLYEPVDVKILDKLINSDLLKVEFHNPLCKGYENEKQLLLSYKKLIKKGKAEVKYNKAKGIKYGRVNPHKALGLFSIRREIRHTLAKGTFIDIDIENCHPVILLQICEANDIETKYLKKYVNKRQRYLDEVMENYKVSRDEAKRLFIRLLYFGKFNSWINSCEHTTQKKEIEELPFIQNFALELNQIGTKILEANPDLRKEVEKRKDNNYNLIGSVVSYFLQEYENRILEAVYLYCDENGYIKNNVAVLCADGLMIEEKYYKESLLNELVELVDKQFEFKVKFTTKEFNQDYLSILDDHQVESTSTKCNAYLQLKEEFEQKNFKLLDPVGFITIRDDGTLILRNKKDFMTVYENLLYTNEDKEVSFVNEWLKDSTNRTYRRIDFLPTQKAPADVYNTFKGFVVENKTVVKSDIENSLIMKHIKNLCNNEETVYNYVLKFFSNLVKCPYNISKTALIFKSVQGCGKDTLFDWFGNHILGGDYYINTDKAELIFGKFNSSIENKILVVMNETSGRDTFSINENIKCAITAKENHIEHKGKTPYKNSNNIGYIFATNNDNPLKIPHDDRRFCGIEANNNIANNHEYFKSLIDEMESGVYDRAFYDYLMSLDVEHYDFTNNRPVTDFYNNMKELNTPVLAKFFEYIIDEHSEQELVTIQASRLYERFMNFVKENNFKMECTSTKFGIDIKHYTGITKRRLAVGYNLSIDILELKEHLKNKYKIEFINVDFVDQQESRPQSEADMTTLEAIRAKQTKLMEEYNKLSNLENKILDI